MFLVHRWSTSWLLSRA